MDGDGAGGDAVSYTVEVVKVKASFPWAIRATVEGIKEPRYRGYRYKKEALTSLSVWEGLPTGHFMREFHHNFDSAQMLGITPANTGAQGG